MPPIFLVLASIVDILSVFMCLCSCVCVYAAKKIEGKQINLFKLSVYFI